MSHNLLAVAPVSTLTGTEFLYIVKDGADGRIQLNQISGGSSPVTSVAGRIGDVVLSVGDVSGALSSATAASTYQPLDLDLSNIAALTTTAFGRSFLTQTDAASTKVTLSLSNVDNTSDVNKPVSSATTTALNLKLNLTGGTLSGFLTLHADPTSALHAVTKQYVDNLTIGLSFKNSVVVATTANITLSGAQTIDGIGVVAGNRVLVKNQTTTSANGIYVAAVGAWTRALDADVWDELVSAYLLVEQGTINADSGWVCPVDRGGTLGVTAVTFAQFSGGGSVSAGYGISVVGSTVALGNIAANTLYGNNTGSATPPIALTAAQVKTFLAIGISDVTGAAPLASPTFTGVPLSTTAAVNTNTTQIATTAFVLGQASSASPLMDGTVATGSSFRYSREDHVHPSDTSRVAVNTVGNWATVGAGQTSAHLGWKFNGAGSVIFDASAGTSPTGSVINATTPANPISAGGFTPATLMGWNGTSTFGVRVDRAQTADNAFLLNGQAASFYATDANVVHKTGDESITGIKTITGRVHALGTTTPIDGQVQLIVGTPSVDAGASAAGIMFVHNNVAYRGWLGYYSGSSTLTYRSAAGSHAGGTEVFSIASTGVTTAGIAKMGTSSSYATNARFGHSSFDLGAGYGFLQDNVGAVTVDAATGQRILLKNNNTIALTIGAANTAATTTTTGTAILTGGIGVSATSFFGGDLNLATDGAALKFVNAGTNGTIQSSGGTLSITSSAGSSGATTLALRTVSDRKISIGPSSGFVGSATVTYTTASTNTTTGALIVNGGLGVAGTINAGAITTGVVTSTGVISVPTIITISTTLGAHHKVVCNSATAITVTLPAASANNGREYVIKNKNAGVVTLDATTAGQLDAVSNTTTLPNGSGITVFSDGVTWLRL